MRIPEERWPVIIHSSWISLGRRKRGYFGGEVWEGGREPISPYIQVILYIHCLKGRNMQGFVIVTVVLLVALSVHLKNNWKLLLNRTLCLVSDLCKLAS
jgi:hypothetical protein